MYCPLSAAGGKGGLREAARLRGSENEPRGSGRPSGNRLDAWLALAPAPLHGVGLGPQHHLHVQRRLRPRRGRLQRQRCAAGVHAHEVLRLEREQPRSLRHAAVRQRRGRARPDRAGRRRARDNLPPGAPRPREPAVAAGQRLGAVAAFDGSRADNQHQGGTSLQALPHHVAAGVGAGRAARRARRLQHRLQVGAAAGRWLVVRRGAAAERRGLPRRTC